MFTVAVWYTCISKRTCQGNVDKQKKFAGGFSKSLHESVVSLDLYKAQTHTQNPTKANCLSCKCKMCSNVLSKLSIILPVKCFQIWPFFWQTSSVTTSEQKIYKGWKQLREVLLVFPMPSCTWNMCRLCKFGQNFLGAPAILSFCIALLLHTFFQS